MLDPARRQNTPRGPSALTISPLGRRTLLCLKSWRPVTSGGPTAVVLDGLAMPMTVGETVAGSRQVLCLGPGEWMLMVGREALAAGWRERLQQDAQSLGITVVDVSDGLQGLALHGVDVRDLLTKGCGVDFHEKQFPASRGVRTRLVQIPVVIVRMGESSGFEICVARSYVQYLTDWLIDASIT